MADSTIAAYKTANPSMCADAVASLDVRIAAGEMMSDAWDGSVNGVWLHRVLRSGFPSSVAASRAAIGSERMRAAIYYQTNKTEGRASAQQIIDGDALLATLATDVRAAVPNPFV